MGSVPRFHSQQARQQVPHLSGSLSVPKPRVFGEAVTCRAPATQPWVCRGKPASDPLVGHFHPGGVSGAAGHPEGPQREGVPGGDCPLPSCSGTALGACVTSRGLEGRQARCQRPLPAGTRAGHPRGCPTGRSSLQAQGLQARGRLGCDIRPPPTPACGVCHLPLPWAGLLAPTLRASPVPGAAESGFPRPAVPEWVWLAGTGGSALPGSPLQPRGAWQAGHRLRAAAPLLPAAPPAAQVPEGPLGWGVRRPPGAALQGWAAVQGTGLRAARLPSATGLCVRHLVGGSCGDTPPRSGLARDPGPTSRGSQEGCSEGPSTQGTSRDLGAPPLPGFPFPPASQVRSCARRAPAERRLCAWRCLSCPGRLACLR